jgi:hypothetical protein
MNPLPIVRDIGEAVDEGLRDFEPVADSDFLADELP